MAFLMRALLGRRQETQKTGISSGSGTGRSPPVVSSPSYPSEIKIKWKAFSLNKLNPAEFILSETESWLEKGVSLHEGFKDEGFKKKNRSVWTSLSLAEVFRPLVAYAADDDSSSSSAGVKNTRGWERPGVPPIRPAPPKPKPLLSLDSNIVIEAGRGKLEVSHPKLKALLDRHQLVVSDRLVPEIKDEGARSFLHRSCMVQPLVPAATDAAVLYSDILGKFFKVKFEGNEHIDLACYLDACYGGLPHATMDHRFLDRLLSTGRKRFQEFLDMRNVTQSPLNISIKGTQPVSMAAGHVSDKAAEHEYKFVKVVRD